MADNVRLVRECFDAFGRGDPDFIVARVSNDVDGRHAGGPEIPYGGRYKGRDGVGQFFTRIGAAVDLLTWEPKHVLAAGAQSAAKVRPVGLALPVQWPVATTSSPMVFGLRNGEIASFRVVEDTATVAAAFR